jgi:hypothetical protein
MHTASMMNPPPEALAPPETPKRITLSENQVHILKELRTSYPKGRPLDVTCRRSAGRLISAGYVTWFEAAGIRIYIATKRGLEVLDGLTN